jgi:predicted DNA-binding protein with PD1-like motif
MECNSVYGLVIEQGEIIPKALEITSKPLLSDFVDVNGFGELGWVEVTHDKNDEKTIRFSGPLQLISLRGRIRRAGNLVISDFVCCVSRETDNGIQVLGGRMTKAQVNHLEVTLTPLLSQEDLAGERSLSQEDLAGERSEGVEVLPKPASPVVVTSPEKAKQVAEVSLFQKPPAAKVEKKPVMDERWAKAVVESRRIEDEADFLDEASDARPRQGDVVNHKQFGECSVSMISDDHITLRKPDGRNVQLGLQILNFKRVGHRDGKDVFDVQVAVRR